MSAAKRRGPGLLGKHVWTPEDDLIVIEGYQNGDLTEQIAARIGVTTRAVQGRAPKLFIKHRDKSRTVEERFLDYVRPDEETGCLLWIGAKNAKGYGTIGIRYSSELAHRVAMQIAGIEIPHGMSICHRCDTPACVNVDHLFIGTHLDNIRDCRAKGRLVQMRQSRKGTPVADTDCINGHALSGDNLITHKSGGTACRMCRNYNARMLRLRRRAA